MQIVKHDFAIFDVFPDPPKRVTVHLLTSWNSCGVLTLAGREGTESFSTLITVTL